MISRRHGLPILVFVAAASLIACGRPGSGQAGESARNDSSGPPPPSASADQAPPAVADQPAAPSASPSRDTAESAATNPRPPTSRSEELKRFLGARARVVWVQDAGKNDDTFLRGTRLRLMALDTDDGRGERVLADQPGNYAKPLLTPGGDRVIYSNREEGAVYTVGWDGDSRPARIADGFALATWRDPAGREYVFVGEGNSKADTPQYERVFRHPLDDPATRELVWDRAPVAEDNLQLSRDGRTASGVFPWPNAGVANLGDGSWQRIAHGCWTSLSPDDRRILSFLDEGHRILTIVDGDRRTKVNLDQAPGIGGFEVYHPRWSNKPRYFVMTGPYKVYAGLFNRIRSGGPEVEIHLGRFDAAVTGVEAWYRVTENERADFFPDVWIADTP